MDTRDRLLLALLGCHSLDLDHLARLWERYGLDIDLGDGFRPGGYAAVMAATLERIALSFLEAHGLPEDEPRDEHNNFLASGVAFRDPDVQALFESWLPAAR